MRRSPKRQPPPSMRPWQCGVLGVDPGEEGGVAFFACGVYQWSRPIHNGYQRRIALNDAWQHCKAEHIPLIIIGETWTPHGKMNFAAALGLGAHWGRWLERIDELQPQLHGQWAGPKVVRAKVKDWRRAIFGPHREKATEEWKRLAMMRAAQYGPETSDEAEAILIAEYGTRAGVVGDALPKRVREEA